QELINHLYQNMEATKRVMHGRMHVFAGECPISLSQMELLFTLKHMQPTSPKQLGNEMKLTPGAISQLLEGLVERGLVERRHDPTDRRAQTISLSSSGKTQLSDIEKRRGKILQSVLQELTTEELEVLLRVQEKLSTKIAQASQ
ncbi:MAG: MarR family winged helix-turn-helix transcriptional regulator, partial [Candidatus Saccharimonadales bacterium]